MNDIVLSTTKLTKTFKTHNQELVVLKDINMTIKRGEHLAITGPSGSGKSTLLHILALLETCTCTNLTILNQNTATLTPTQQAKFRRQNLGFVYQEHHLFPELNVSENINLPLKLQNLKTQDYCRQTKNMLAAIGLSEYATSPISHLSGGQKQRVAIARALITKPALIFADEPTGNLDSTTATSIMNLIFELANKHNITLITVTHDLSVANRFTTIYQLNNHQLVVQHDKNISQ